MIRRRRRRPAIIIPIVSMGDIAFLLIIFFMVCSNFAREASIELSLPKSPDIEALKESAISVVVDANGNIFVQGQRVSQAQSVESQVASLLEGRTGDQQRTVLFKCDKGVDKAVFEPVIEAVARAGGTIAAIGERQGR